MREKAESAADIDPRRVSEVRTGNALGPGLMTFTGLSFFAYLLVKGATGAAAVDLSWAIQVAVSGALFAVGALRLMRARYFYVVVVTEDGRRRIGGLTKAQQTEIAERLRSGVS